MNNVTGGLFAGYGIVGLLQVFFLNDAYLNEGVRLRNEGVRLGLSPEDRCNRITRIAANALQLIGNFWLAFGTVVLGATMMSIGPEAAFITGITQGFNASIRYLAASVVILTSGNILKHLATPD